MSGICIISNPNSRQNKVNPRLAQSLKNLLSGHGDLVETPNLDSLKRAAEEIAKGDYDLIAMNGGDGTNHHSLTALIHAYGDKKLPPVVFLKGGTMNTVPGALGVKGSPKSILKKVVERYSQGKPLPITVVDTIEIEGAFGFLFGTGMMANFLDVYYEGGDASPWKAVKVLSAGVVSAAVSGPLIKRIAKKLPLKLTVDGEDWPIREYDIVGAGTIPSVAWMFRPFYKAMDDLGTFHLWGVDCGPWELAKSLPKIMAAADPKNKGIHEKLTSEVLIEATDADTIQYQIDGDLYTSKGKSITLKMGPSVQVVVP